MRKCYIVASFLMMATLLFAVPAKRGIFRTIRLADGTEVKVELRGDEHINYWQAEDGNRYVKDAVKDFYVPADMEALMQKAEQNRMKAPLRQAPSKVAIGGSHPAFTGAKKGLIILAEFTDKKFQPGHDAEYYTHVANDLNFTSADGHVGSIRDYFLAQSEGQFDLTFDVVGPVQLQYDMAYYGAPSGNNSDCNAGAMIREAVQGAAKVLPSFADYDWFGDGDVDQVFVIYAGRGEASGGGENTIWPHRYSISPLNIGGKRVSVYACSCEMQSDTHVDGIGTFCHEFSHCLGLPDLYDTKYSGNYAMGTWDIMSSGSYLGNSFRPCAYSGYERNYCGWKNPTVLTEDTKVENMRGISEGGDYYIIYNDAYKDEYYILENRTQTGWDTELYGSGLLITYIDFDQFLWTYNMVNTTDGYYNDHQRYTPFLADNNTAQNYVNDIAGDVYPYGRNNSLTNTSVPASTLYHANIDGQKLMSKPVTNIKRNVDGSISFDFANEVGKTPEMPEDGIYFHETFDGCDGIGGNDGTWTNRDGAGTFGSDMAGWDYEAALAGDKCAIFKSEYGQARATTPVFFILSDTELTFNAAMYSSTGGKELTLSVDGGSARLSDTEFTMTRGLWNEFRTTISAPSYPAYVRVTFELDKKTFFLDDVKAADPVVTAINSVETDKSHKNASIHIYSLDGRYVGDNFDMLGKGIYIVNGKKVVK